MPGGYIILKQFADLEAGIDIVLGTNQVGIQPLRIFSAAGVFLAGINTLGNFQGGAITYTPLALTTTGSITSGIGMVTVDGTLGAFTATLPAIGASARTLYVVKIDSSSNPVTVAPAGADTINGVNAGILLQSQWAGVFLVSNAAGNWATVNGDFAASAGNIHTVTTTYTVNRSDYKILANATGGAFTATLPAASSVPPGWETRIEKIDASGNAVTVSRAGADLIEGATTVSLAAPFNLTRLTSDGVSNWFKL